MYHVKKRRRLSNQMIFPKKTTAPFREPKISISIPFKVIIVLHKTGTVYGLDQHAYVINVKLIEKIRE